MSDVETTPYRNQNESSKFIIFVVSGYFTNAFRKHVPCDLVAI